MNPPLGTAGEVLTWPVAALDFGTRVLGGSACRLTPCTPDLESDNHDSMRTVTATEASRSFAALLDEVEQGQTVIVTRGGRRIATIGPATNGNGADVLALLQASSVDDGFAADVLAVRQSVDAETPSWPED